ncbi:MAG TPA: hypothetical protein DIT62_03765 [Alphaproteobacteria bacterium]|nr:hypothetical protein [Alphaproteobacteria bacterium]
MCGLAHYFESEGLSTVLVGFVREHMEAIKPPRGLFLDFPMGRGMGKPNDPDFQKKVIRASFDLLDVSVQPVLADFPDVIPVKDGRMGYALPPELVLSISDIGDVDALLAEVAAEMNMLHPDYEVAVASRGRTTVGASELAITDYAPFVGEFVRGDIPKSPRKGLPAIPLLKLVVEDLEAYYTETRTHRDGIDDLELMGKWFWEETKAGRLLLCLEAVSIASDDRVMRQIVEMSLMAPRFWSEGPLPGTSAAGW